MRKLVFALFTAITMVFASCETQEIQPVTEGPELKSGTKVLNFRTHLSGMNEVPPYETEATGQAIFQLSKNGEELYYKLIVDDISDVTASHIHMAPAGINGGVVALLYSGAPAGPVEGVLAEGTITSANLLGGLAGMQIADLVDAMYNGNTYVNVHTSAKPGGEIRGQISGNMPMGN